MNLPGPFSVLALLAACGPGPTPSHPASPAAPAPAAPAPAAPAAPSGPLTVELQVSTDRGGALTAIASGTVLHPGDKFSVSVEPDRPAYVYVLHRSASGAAVVLFPDPGEDNRISGTIQVPPDGWFMLDAEVGEETLFVVASAEPLEQVDAEVSRRITDVQAAQAGPPAAAPIPAASEPPTKTGAAKNRPRPESPRARPAPAQLDLASRGIVRVRDSASAAVIVTADDQGVAVFRFSLHNAARP